jgi:hypothetical protein
MDSEYRIPAPRINTPKSRASAVIPARHADFSRRFLLSCESPERFSALLTQLENEFQPRPGVETLLIKQMAYCRWRQMRLWGMETASLNHELSTQTPEGPDNRRRAALAIRNIAGKSNWFDFMNRYHSRCERQYAGTKKAFLDVRAGYFARINQICRNEPEPPAAKSAQPPETTNKVN